VIEILFSEWIGGVFLGAGIATFSFGMSSIAAWRHQRALELRLEKAHQAIFTLRDAGWTTPEDDEAKLRRLAAPARVRGKDGRFLSRDAAARAAGIPVDFARIVGAIEAHAEKRRAWERGEAPWGRDMGGAPLGPPRLEGGGPTFVESAVSVREADFAIGRRGQEERDRALGDAIDGHFVPAKKQRRG
jgi:hypothetical protein